MEEVELTTMQKKVAGSLMCLFAKHRRPIRRMEIENDLGRGRIDNHLRLLVASGKIRRVSYGGYIPEGQKVVL